MKAGKIARKVFFSQLCRPCVISVILWSRFADVASARKFVREIRESKNGTQEHHIDSMESLISRENKIYSNDVNEWLESRDFSQLRFLHDKKKAIEIFKENIARVVKYEHSLTKEVRDKAAMIVSSVVDRVDPVGEHLFEILMEEYEPLKLL